MVHSTYELVEEPSKWERMKEFFASRDLGKSALRNIALDRVLAELSIDPGAEGEAEDRRPLILDNGQTYRLRDADFIMRSPTDELHIVFNDPVMLEGFLARIAARATFDAILDEGLVKEYAEELFGSPTKIAHHLLDGIVAEVTIDGRTRVDDTVAYRMDRLSYLVERLADQGAVR